MLAVAALLTTPLPSNAQLEPTTKSVAAPSSKVEMADVMRQNGKIYVVVAVILLIFSGLTVYLFRIDRKVSKLEKELS